VDPVITSRRRIKWQKEGCQAQINPIGGGEAAEIFHRRGKVIDEVRHGLQGPIKPLPEIVAMPAGMTHNVHV
jgi:hypothetical protein